MLRILTQIFHCHLIHFQAAKHQVFKPTKLFHNICCVTRMHFYRGIM